MVARITPLTDYVQNRPYTWRSIKEETSQHRWPDPIFCYCNCNGAHLSALIAHSAISSYSSNLWGMLGRVSGVATQCVQWAHFFSVKHPETRTDHSSRSCAKVKSVWSYSPYVSKAWFLFKHRANFTSSIRKVHAVCNLEQPSALFINTRHNEMMPSDITATTKLLIYKARCLSKAGQREGWPRSKICLTKLLATSADQDASRFYGTQMFISVFAKSDTGPHLRSAN
jgi:hypothetical protein